MKSDWHWFYKQINFKKEGMYNELWSIWWTICTTGVERKIK